ncbi:hypothetical protein D9M71_301720 [compost metagenome]
MAGGDPVAHAAAARFLGQHLEKARVRIVGLVAMHIHQATAALGQVHEELHGTDALLAGVFKVRDTADHVGAEADRLFHQLATFGEGFDAFLREGDDLHVQQMTVLLAQFEHGLQGGEAGIGHVDVRAHMLDAMRDQHLQGAAGALPGVLGGDAGLAFGPAFDAFEQRAAHVPARLAGGQHGIQMDMRLDEGRHHQIAAGIHVVLLRYEGCGLRVDGGDQRAFQYKAVQAFPVAQTGIDDFHEPELHG